MAFIQLITANKPIYTRTMLHAVGRAGSDAELRANLRLITAVLLAVTADHQPWLTEKHGELFDIVTSEKFHDDGYNKTRKGHDERLWFCSYVGFEKLTSQWALEHAKQCHGVICMRITNQDEKKELDAHTLQVYF